MKQLYLYNTAKKRMYIDKSTIYFHNGPGCHPQNIIWTEAKLRSIYYFVSDRPVHKLPFGPKRHELFVILYSIHANLSSTTYFCYCISKTKNEFGQNPEENIILIGLGQYTKILWEKGHVACLTQEPG
jgi:hypothetical protein